MKITAFFAIIIILFVSSCSLPVSRTTTSPTPVNPKDLISTMVASTITAKPIIPTAITPSSTQTATIITETPTLTVTPEASATSSETNQPSVTPTSDDFAASLGEPTWKDTFVSSSGFFQKGSNSYEDDHTRIVIENGMMTLTSYGTPPNWRGWRLTYPTIKNFYLETSFITHNCSGADQYGMVFRAPNYSSGLGYYFAFTCAGAYNLMRMDDSGFVSIVNLTQNADILAGNGQKNRMGILATGGTLSLYANGKKLIEANDGQFQDAGHFGPFIAYADNPNFSVDLTSIAYWSMP